MKPYLFSLCKQNFYVGWHTDDPIWVLIEFDWPAKRQFRQPYKRFNLPGTTDMKSPDPHILCVDDDIQTCEWIRGVLGNKVNATITTANTGHDALERLQNVGFDLCILEYALPDMTGVQLCSLVRRMGLRVPMMFFTAMDRPVDVQMALAAGASDYLYKPEDRDIFVDAVIHLLKRGRPAHTENSGIAGWPKAA